MVSVPASTGNASRIRNAVTRMDHTNSGIRNMVMPGARMLKMAVMKLMAPRMEEAPARCSARKPDRQVAWHVLGAVLHALRDRLQIGLAVQATLGGAIPGARVAAAQGHTSGQC